MAGDVTNKFNVALVGHGGTGKTTYLEGLLFTQGLITRMGRVQDGNTVLDYTPEEIRARHSIYCSVLPLTYRGNSVNLLDVPGYLDFVGEMVGALSVVEGAVIFVNAVSGIEAQTYRSWEQVHDRLACAIFVNFLDREDTDFFKLSNELRAALGKKCVPLSIPYKVDGQLKGTIDLLSQQCFVREGNKLSAIDVPDEMKASVDELRFSLIEAIVEQDEALFEKYVAEEKISDNELKDVLRKAICSFQLVPILAGSGEKLVGVEGLVDAIISFFPHAGFPGKIQGVDGSTGKPTERILSADAPFCARVFKVISEPHIGELAFMRIYSGKLRLGDNVYNSSTGETEKISSLIQMRGKERKDLTEASAGDIVATVKLKDTHIGNTLCAKDQPVQLPPIIYPKPVSFEAIEVEDKNVLEKVSTSLAKVREEDQSLAVEMNEETRQLVVYGMGELHLHVVKEKLAERYGAKIEWTSPRIPYRETITGTASAQGKYKKQTGGRGQYGDVWLKLEPCTDGEFKFINKIVGGVVPSRFIPAVEKGIIETMHKGVLAGYRVTGVQVTLYDGTHHSVDSSELAFKIAASIGFKRAFADAKPILLEPIYKVMIYVPEQFVGDVISDLNTRRGKVQKSGASSSPRLHVIEAFVPLAELYKYINTLRSITQGLGYYEMEYSHYEEVPAQIAQAIIASARKEVEEEE